MDKKMKLKVRDQIIENDGICVIVYKIVKISGEESYRRNRARRKDLSYGL